MILLPQQILHKGPHPIADLRRLDQTPGPGTRKVQKLDPSLPQEFEAFWGRERDDKPSKIVEVVEFVHTSPLP